MRGPLAVRRIHRFGVHANGVHDLIVSNIYDPRYAVLRARLRAARLAAGMTQVEAGAQLGQNQQFINRCEAGDRRIDALELIDFARLYGREPLDLLPLDDSSDPHGGSMQS